MKTPPDNQTSDNPNKSRREFLAFAGRISCVGALSAGAVALLIRSKNSGRESCSLDQCKSCQSVSDCSKSQAIAYLKSVKTVWQIDPRKCIECGKCETACVLATSAVKCVHAYDLCGRCNFCTAYYQSLPLSKAGSGAEYQLCPTDAITRTPVKGMGYRNFEFTIDETLCTGCGKCVSGCKSQNGSMYLQVKRDLCIDCNDCAIAAACPAGAFVKIPANTPYFLKESERWG